jgi:hypothetical protein
MPERAKDAPAGILRHFQIKLERLALVGRDALFR